MTNTDSDNSREWAAQAYALLKKQKEEQKQIELKQKEEQKQIELKQKEELKQITDEVSRTLDQRNKYYAHSDKEYFFNPEKLSNDFPSTTKDLISILNVVIEIVAKPLLLKNQPRTTKTTRQISSCGKFCWGYFGGGSLIKCRDYRTDSKHSGSLYPETMWGAIEGSSHGYIRLDPN